jgi:hypothetical protein
MADVVDEEKTSLSSLERGWNNIRDTLSRTNQKHDPGEEITEGGEHD